MGGHGDKWKIPSPDIYKIENYPELKKFQERLAKEGLKDPWLRNYAWRFQPFFQTFGQRAALLLTGWKIGVPLFLLHISFDHFWGYAKKGHEDNEKHH